jgi:hypothetical protein
MIKPKRTIVVFICLLQGCALFQTAPVTVTENDVIHRQHALLQQKTLVTLQSPLHEEWEKTWALEDKWEQNTHFWSNHEKEHKVTTKTVAYNQTVETQQNSSTVKQEILQEPSQPETEPTTFLIDLSKELTPPQKPQKTNKFQKREMLQVAKTDTPEDLAESTSSWNLKTLIDPTLEQDYQRCPIQPVHLATEQSLPIAEPQSVPDWQYQEIKKILLEFGEHEDFQVPIDFQKQVAKWITRFTKESSQARTWFTRALQRMDKYYPTIDDIFSEKQLPTSLYYLALIESGFNPTVRSHAGAVGLWQFIPSTARRYGLKVSADTDQRTQPERATYAAREYLLDLILEFGDGHSVLLAMAAYNAGENGIRKRLRSLDNYRLRSFWTLAKQGLLPTETHDYVPKILAAVIIGRNRAHFGFEENPNNPFKLASFVR